jgi:hypothetical protein
MNDNAAYFLADPGSAIFRCTWGTAPDGVALAIADCILVC